MLYLDGLGYVHFINLNLREAASRYILVFLVIAIKKVSGIYSDADGSLQQRNKRSAGWRGTWSGRHH